MIPSLLANGHLPVGRFNATLVEIEAEFVTASRFALSTTRAHIWDGFLDYLAAWSVVESALSADLLKAVWIGGSFISSELDPSDIDISPVHDEGAIRAFKGGGAGVGQLKRVIGHRAGIRAKFSVEPFPVPWIGVASTLFPSRLAPSEVEYLSSRGGMDDWWQRKRPPGPKAPPVAPIGFGDRGYLEVTL